MTADLTSLAERLEGATAKPDALEYAIEIIEWTNYIRYDEPEEIIDGYTRYSPAGRPNAEAAKRANEVRALAGLPLRDYGKEFPGDYVRALSNPKART